MTKEFEIILSWIKDDKLRDCVTEQVNNLPDYFWHVPASSSGKYHPEYCLGEGGLARHVAAACKIAKELFPIRNDFSDKDKDVILSALILHDGYKHGTENESCGHTVHEHPILMHDHLIGKYVNDIEHLNADMFSVAMCVASHMGQWTTSEYSSVLLPSPSSPIESFVHTCDYLASRKCIAVNFEG